MDFSTRQVRASSILAMAFVFCLVTLQSGKVIAAPPSLPLAQAEETPEPQILTSGSLAPCNLRGDHNVEPRIVQQGETVTVKAEYDFNCVTDGTRRVDLLFVLEDTTILRAEQDRAGRQPLTNLKDALGRYVIAIDPTNESRVGMIKYAGNWTGAPTIGRGEEHFQLFLNNVNRLQGSTGNCANPGSAMRAASGQINSLSKSDPTDPPSIMIVIDAGALPCSTVPISQQADLQNACNAAKAERVTVALIALRNSNGRMRGCNSPGWYYRSSSETGADLPAILEDLRDRTLRDQKPRETVYSDWFNSEYWEYVFASGSPRDPDTFFGDLGWNEAVPQVPKAKYTYTYQMRALEAPAEVPVTLSPGPAIILQFPQVADYWYLPQDTVCIYRSGRMEQDCGNFALRLTQEALPPTEIPTETPDGLPTNTMEPPPETETPDTPTPDTPTVEPSSPTPTEVPVMSTATPTEDVGVPKVYLPLAKNDAP